MQKVNLPKITEEKIADFQSKFSIEPLYPGYGATIGNSLRRVLLSSITGAAATSFKVEGISHEFSAIPHIKEDVVELMMNLKSINFKSFSDEPVVLEISKKGSAVVTAADIKKNSNIEIANPDQHIVTLDKGADFYMEITVEKDRGFRPTVIGSDEKGEIGRIAIDALFSPVERVSMNITDTRVGQMTNYDKLTLDIITNGTLRPADALAEASQVLVDHYSAIMAGTGEVHIEPATQGFEPEEVEAEYLDAEDESDESDTVDNKSKIDDLNLSARTQNALLNAGIKTLGGLNRLSPLKLEEIKGLGKKGIDEINSIINK